MKSHTVKLPATWQRQHLP